MLNSNLRFSHGGSDVMTFGNLNKQNRLMKLAENIRSTKSNRKNKMTRKKALKSDPGYTNSIEHLVHGVYRSRIGSTPNSIEKEDDRDEIDRSKSSSSSSRRELDFDHNSKNGRSLREQKDNTKIYPTDGVVILRCEQLADRWPTQTIKEAERDKFDVVDDNSSRNEEEEFVNDYQSIYRLVNYERSSSVGRQSFDACKQPSSSSSRLDNGENTTLLESSSHNDFVDADESCLDNLFIKAYNQNKNGADEVKTRNLDSPCADDGNLVEALNVRLVPEPSVQYCGDDNVPVVKTIGNEWKPDWDANFGIGSRVDGNLEWFGRGKSETRNFEDVDSVVEFSESDANVDGGFVKDVSEYRKGSDISFDKDIHPFQQDIVVQEMSSNNRKRDVAKVGNVRKSANDSLRQLESSGDEISSGRSGSSQPANFRESKSIPVKIDPKNVPVIKNQRLPKLTQKRDCKAGQPAPSTGMGENRNSFGKSQSNLNRHSRCGSSENRSASAQRVANDQRKRLSSRSSHSCKNLPSLQTNSEFNADRSNSGSFGYRKQRSSTTSSAVQQRPSNHFRSESALNAVQDRKSVLRSSVPISTSKQNPNRNAAEKVNENVQAGFNGAMSRKSGDNKIDGKPREKAEPSEKSENILNSSKQQNREMVKILINDDEVSPSKIANRCSTSPRKYSTHMFAQNHLRASSGNIEKKICAFKQNRALSESVLSKKPASLIPVPVRTHFASYDRVRNHQYSNSINRAPVDARRKSLGSVGLQSVNVSDSRSSHSSDQNCNDSVGFSPSRTVDGNDLSACKTEDGSQMEAKTGGACLDDGDTREDDESRIRSASNKLDMLVMNSSCVDVGDVGLDRQITSGLSDAPISLSVENDLWDDSRPRGDRQRPLSSDCSTDLCLGDLSANFHKSTGAVNEVFDSGTADVIRHAPRFSSLRYHSHKSSRTALQKFKKTFSLRFHKNKKCGGNFATPSSSSQWYLSSGQESSDDQSTVSYHPATVSGTSPPASRKTEPFHQVDKSGENSGSTASNDPVVRRASRDFKHRTCNHRKKDIRDSKCSSADSGIQIELVHNNYDVNANNACADNKHHLNVKQQPPIPPHNTKPKYNPASPIVVRRRKKSLVGSNGASDNNGRRRNWKRPLSDLGGSINDPGALAEAMRVGLIIRNNHVNPDRTLRRTKSDLGADEYAELHRRRSICNNTASFSSEKLTAPDSKHASKDKNRLRRSVSQPLACIEGDICFDVCDGNLIQDEAFMTGRRRSSFVSSPHHQHLRQQKMSATHSVDSVVKQPIDARSIPECGIDKNFETFTYAEALWNHVTMDPEELAFKAGDVVDVMDTSDEDWWWGVMGTKSGWFPASFVWLRVNQDNSIDECFADINDCAASDTDNDYPGKRSSVTGLGNDRIRSKIIHEIISNERDYFTHLKDLTEGYLTQVRKRSDMFSEENVNTIFGNIEQLYVFQKKFLSSLESRLDRNRLHDTQFGSCFVQHRDDFKIYSEYCNNHPPAVSLLQELYASPKYLHFFEACRLLQDMIDISLDGFLLTPVQKICKYPLQLAELLKHTRRDHPDYQHVSHALDTMKNVAHLINERKRRMECLEKLASWQSTVVDWEGPDLLSTSTELIYAGEVSKLTSWSREVSLFLFDHLLIYCKRDLLKRNVYVYKGRIDLDTSDVVNVDDGKDATFGVSVKHAWRIDCKDRNKSYLFYARTSDEKERWMNAFVKERRRVHDDLHQGFVVTDKAKKLAVIAAEKAKSIKRPKVKTLKQPSGGRANSVRPMTKQGARSIINAASGGLYLALPVDENRTLASSRTGSLPHGVSLSVHNLNVNPACNSVRKKTNNSTGSSWFNFGSTKKAKR